MSKSFESIRTTGDELAVNELLSEAVAANPDAYAAAVIELISNTAWIAAGYSGGPMHQHNLWCREAFEADTLHFDGLIHSEQYVAEHLLSRHRIFLRAKLKLAAKGRERDGRSSGHAHQVAKLGMELLTQ